MGADVSEALDGGAALLRLDIDSLEQFHRESSNTAPGGFFTPACAVLLHGFAGDDRRIEPMVFFPLVAEPRHHFVIGSHVGIGTDDLVDLVHERTRHALHLPFRQCFWIDTDATFRAAVGEIHNSGFPCHQRCECADFVEIHRWVVTQPTFHRSTSIVVLNAIAEDRFDPAIIPFKGDLDRHFPFGCRQQLTHPIGHLHLISRLTEIQVGRFAGTHDRISPKRFSRTGTDSTVARP